MKAVHLQGLRVLVVGLGKSGLAAARFLKERGARVTVSDARPALLIKELPSLLDAGIMVETGSHGLLTFRRQDLIVVSPGVPVDVPELVQVRALGMRIVGEFELGARFLQGEVIAVTGSNGKTTTTTLLGEILKASGRPTLVGGNIGKPVVDLVAESVALRALGGAGDADSSASLRDGEQAARGDDDGAALGSDNAAAPGSDNAAALGSDNAAAQRNGNREEVWSVLEASSFQLETVESFRPRIALVLNLTPDHMDRHGTFARYAAAKARITENQTAEDFLVLNAEDKATQMIAAHVFPNGQRTKAQIYWFSARRQVKQGAFVQGETIFFRASEGGAAEPVMPVSEIPLAGEHNVENVLAAVCATWLAGVEAAVVRETVARFKAVEHRLEFVRELGGVRYFNDSKATNVDATAKALGAFPGGVLPGVQLGVQMGVHLILGGKDKDSDYSVLAPLLRERAKTVITIGSAAEKIERELAGVVKMESMGTMDRAVARARELAAAGDVVLLAPACASFDQFENYEQRGRVFKELVWALK